MTVTGKVDLGARNMTVDARDAGGSATGANLTFNQTIDGGALVLNGGTMVM